MSHPVLWNKNSFFYPLGNTAPVCLTQDLAPEDDADILLLGCGDPRSILYTLYAGPRTAAVSPRTLDFTCCDVEPAVLARNVLLLTMIVDNKPVERIWDIFFHFRLSLASFDLLVTQCNLLVSISENTESWNSSPYSTFLRFCTAHTLSVLRRHWTWYMEAKDFTAAKEEKLLKAIQHQYTKHNGHALKTGCKEDQFFSLSASRSAGPFWMHSVEALGTHFNEYWHKGSVLCGQKHLSSLKHTNPTFVYSQGRETCAVHYGTFPLQGFHLAIPHISKTTSQLPIERYVESARKQFQDWTISFRTSVSPNSPTKVFIRMVACDALSFCPTLNNFRLTGSFSCGQYIGPWQGTELALSKDEYANTAVRPSPTQFDIIDTSNVVDHVGLLNLLLVSIPVLRHAPSSTLYSETLLTLGGEDADSAFLKRLLGDPSFMFILFGLAPTGCISRFTSDSRVHEIIALRAHQAKQYHERLVWKIPYFGSSSFDKGSLPLPQLACDPIELADALYDVYYLMFEEENLARSIQITREAVKGGDMSRSVLHYHRATFVALLKYAQSRLHPTMNWEAVVDQLFDRLHHESRLLLSMNCYQELCSELYLHNVHCVEVLGPRRLEIAPVDLKKGVFVGWKEVPPVVYVILVVPRQKIKILEDMDMSNLGSPMFECDIMMTASQNIFSNIHIIFGRQKVTGTGQETQVTVEEDSQGWSGSSPLIASFRIAAFNLTREPESTRVALGLRSTFATAPLIMKLGQFLHLFECNILERDRVFVSTTPPNIVHPSGALPPPDVSSKSPRHLAYKVDLSFQKERVSSMTMRWDLIESEAVALRNRSTKVSQKQYSPTTILVSVGDEASKCFLFPFLVRHNDISMKIARTSGWIEVKAALQWPPSPSTVFARDYLTISIAPTGYPTLWNVHRVNLDLAPIYKVKGNAHADWISPHLGLSMSDRERRLQEETTDDVLVNVKETLGAFFLHQMDPRSPRVFGLTDPDDGGINAVIFVNHVRLDLASNTILLDCCILPLTKAFLDLHGQTFADQMLGGNLLQVVTKGEEVRAWKHLMPVFVERCRTWSHKEKCEYRASQRIPLSDEKDQNPLCECGAGVDLGSFANQSQWRKFAPYVTRAAISPLGAVSYLESVGGALRNAFHESKENLGQDRTPGAPQCQHCGDRQPEGEIYKVCSRCRNVRYCSPACQKADWKSHKTVCNK